MVLAFSTIETDDVSEKEVICCKACMCGSCCLGWVITIITLLATSLKTLDQGQYGMHFSHWGQTITGDTIGEAGVKNVGPLNSLVRWPSVYQLVYFDTQGSWEENPNEVLRPPVVSRTYDGLQVEVKISFQWKLEPAYLSQIFSILGGGEDIIDGEAHDDKPSFVAALVRFARGTLTNVCSQYTAEQFFRNQTLVEQTMFRALDETFHQADQRLDISVTGLQLRSVDLPDAYEASIAETQQQEQDYKTAMAERDTNIMKMQRELMQAKLEQEQLLFGAQGNVRAIEEENRAMVEQYLYFQRQQADAYGALLMSLANETEPVTALIKLVQQKAIKSHQSDKVTMTM